jgi:hypothetical protein
MQNERINELAAKNVEQTKAKYRRYQLSTTLTQGVLDDVEELET